MSTEVVLLGTAGGPAPVAGRLGIATAVIVDGAVYLVDCGRGAPTAYVEAGLDPSALRAVLVTHQHIDHVGDLGGMLLYPWGGREGVPPIQVVGPDVVQLVAGLLEAFDDHLRFMPQDVPMPDITGLVRAHDLAPTDEPVTVLDDGAIRITAISVRHGRAPSFGYRFDTADGSVVVSGDTVADRRLEVLAAGADLLLHEVVDLERVPEEQRGDLRALHTDVSDVGGVAERAGVRRLVLTHLLPPDPSLDWTGRVQTHLDVIVGSDGLRLPLP
ncbi:MAG TPA: MBL fold metallo-hydrolase [Rhodoglobus sp.]|nr:MBL fold metallo-hydrolase [Rhodoglobus sp.]